MPSLTSLIQEFGLGRTTPRKAISLLEDDGLVIAVQGWKIVVRQQQHWKTGPGA